MTDIEIERLAFAVVLVSLREAVGLTQAQAAVAAKISQSQISLIESGRSNPSLESLRALLAAYGATVEQAGEILISSSGAPPIAAEGA